MEYLLKVNVEDIEKLEDANIDFLIDDLFASSEKIEICFDDKKQMELAKRILMMI